MKAVVLNVPRSRVSPNFDSVALRIAYLLGITVVPAGANYDALHFDSSEKTIPLEMQIRLIDEFRRQDNEEGDWSAEESLQLLKDYRKFKHPPPEIIKSRKIFEKHVNDLFRDYIDETKIRIAQTGFLPLSQILTKEVSGGYSIKDESNTAVIEGYVALSKVLTRTHDKAEGEFFFLPTTFFNFCKEDQWELTLGSDLKKAKKTNGYLQQLFILPNVNLLNAIELESTRNRLKAAAEVFMPELKAWMEAVDAGKPLSETVTFFNERVLPSTAQLLNAMAVDDVLNHASRMMNDLVSAEVFAGELSIEGIWSFYRWANVVQDDTWNILQEALKENGYAEKRLPVMVLLTKNELLTDENAAPPQEEEYKIAPVKKSIDID
jgi:hypothetical protein